MSNGYCTMIETCDEAVKILEKIESVSSIRWWYNDSRPMDSTSYVFPWWLELGDKNELTIAAYGRFRKLPPEEFVNECRRRMPK